jgi:exopolysaccharide biosynthesis WecB/TagA/CpsF family protein
MVVEMSSSRPPQRGPADGSSLLTTHAADKDQTAAGILLKVSNRSSTIDILGVGYACLEPSDAVDEAERLYERSEPAWIAVENVHGLNLAARDRGHKDVLNRADLVLNDGKGVMLAARIKGRRFPADLHGNVFCPMLLARAAERGWRVFLLGAGPGVAERAARQLKTEDSRLQIAGTQDGYFDRKDEDGISGKIRDSGAGLLLVGMGMPLQEQWLDRHLRTTGVRLACTAGAFFDFQAGEFARAPVWMNRIGLEWVYRLMREPRRLWRRYLIGNPLFLARVVREKFRDNRARAVTPR